MSEPTKTLQKWGVVFGIVIGFRSCKRFAERHECFGLCGATHGQVTDSPIDKLVLIFAWKQRIVKLICAVVHKLSQTRCLVVQTHSHVQTVLGPVVFAIICESVVIQLDYHPADQTERPERRQMTVQLRKSFPCHHCV